MFDVLMYLFETYIHTEAELRVDQDKLEQDLTDAGFEREDIYNALLWLEKLADFRNSLGDYRAECDYLELWYEADKRNYKLIKRLAECYEKIKNKPSAVEFYKKYLTVAATADDYEKVKQHLAKLENTDIAPDEGEGLIDKIMRFFNKD